jgi:hypothetical protein
LNTARVGKIFPRWSEETIRVPTNRPAAEKPAGYNLPAIAARRRGTRVRVASSRELGDALQHFKNPSQNISSAVFGLSGKSKLTLFFCLLLYIFFPIFCVFKK